jgi:hypothetical protein
MQRRFVYAMAGALSFLSLTAMSAVRADGDKKDDAKPDDTSIMLAVSFKVGDTARFKSNTNISVGGMDIALEQTSKHTIKEIKDKGDVTLETKDEGGKVTLNGSDMDIPAGALVTLTLDKYNKILSFKPDADNPYLSKPTLHLMAMAERIIFPDKAVKAGDSWKTEIENPAVKDKKVTIKTTFIGKDKVEGVDAWKVKQTLEAETEGSGKMTTEYTALLDASNGQVISGENELKGVPGQMGPVDFKGKVKRLKPEDVKTDKKPEAK